MANMGDRRARLRDARGRTPGTQMQTSRKRSPLSAADISDLKHRPVWLGLGGALRSPRPAKRARKAPAHNTRRGLAGGRALSTRGRKRVIERRDRLPGPPNA